MDKPDAQATTAVHEPSQGEVWRLRAEPLIRPPWPAEIAPPGAEFAIVGRCSPWGFRAPDVHDSWVIFRRLHDGAWWFCPAWSFVREFEYVRGPSAAVAAGLDRTATTR